MPTLNGGNLPQKAKLSDYLNKIEPVRIVGLTPGQEVEIDVSLDGAYKYPDQPQVANWTSRVTGFEGVHTALLAISKSTGFTVRFTNGSEVKNSRGRGITISECNDFTVHDPWVRGARTAGIALSGCDKFTLERPVSIDTGNYQSAKGQGKNYPGSIKLENCSNYTMNQPASLRHMGNGMTPTETSVGTWIDPFCYNINGAQVYVNASPGHTVRGGLCFSRSAAYVVNSEKTNVGASEDVIFDRCYCLDAEWGVGFWGNQGKPNIVIKRAAVTNCVLISKLGIKIHQGANIMSLDESGTILLKPSNLAAGVAANLQLLADRLAKTYYDHAEPGAITAARAALSAAFSALGEPTVDDETFADWLEEGQNRSVAQVEWFARGLALEKK